MDDTTSIPTAKTQGLNQATNDDGRLWNLKCTSIDLLLPVKIGLLLSTNLAFRWFERQDSVCINLTSKYEVARIRKERTSRMTYPSIVTLLVGSFLFRATSYFEIRVVRNLEQRVSWLLHHLHGRVLPKSSCGYPPCSFLARTTR